MTLSLSNLEIVCPHLKIDRSLFNFNTLQRGNATFWGVGCKIELECRNENMNAGENRTVIMECRPNGKWSEDPSSIKCHDHSRVSVKKELSYSNNCGSLKHFFKLGFRTIKLVNNSHAFMKCSKSRHIVPHELSGNLKQISQTTYIKCEEESGNWVSAIEGKTLGDLQCSKTMCNDSNLIQTEVEGTRVCDNVETNAVGDCIRYRCKNEEYHVHGTDSGTATIRCLPDGQWSQNPALFRCVRTVRCNSSGLVGPQLINNPSFSNAKRRCGLRYCENYVCKKNDHYVNGRNNVTIHCLANGAWSQDPNRLHCRGNLIILCN
ncbi:uncharacterized protein LOC134187183 [Corticium candelabrum]|uniref:uncharacterized protein LOC134187183 n=1 Tax=Corticium candelabrum TaxID=121492 RepID=UPI002E25885C|nr:uncharacterized protein LOC134187183 [Corticium candelabrum]